MPKNQIFHLCHMKVDGASITFHQKLWHPSHLFFLSLTLKVAITRTYFLLYVWYLSKHFMHYIMYAITPECFHIFTHPYKASFSLKTGFCKANNIFSRTLQIYTKTLTVSESRGKIKTISRWIIFEILLTSAVICKQKLCAEKKLCNIFKTTNTKNLIKTILENHFKLLKTPGKTTILKQSKHFLQVVQFLATFYV